MKKIFRDLLRLSLSFVVLSCNLFDISEYEKPIELRANLNASFRANIQTLLPLYDISVSTYDVAGTGPGSSSFSEMGFSGNNLVINDLILGSWLISVDAKNAAEEIVGYGEITTELTSGENSVTISILPITGTGTFSYSIEWPTDVLDSPTVTATIVDIAGTESPLTFTTGATSTALSDEPLSSGYYLFSIRIEDHGMIRYAVSLEDVRIWPGQNTSGAIVLTVDDLRPKEQVATPTFTPAPGEYGTAQSISLNCDTVSSSIYYTVNGTAPTQNSGFLWTGTLISVSNTKTIQAVAYREGWVDSYVSQGTFTITGTTASVEFSPLSGLYFDPVQVSLSSSTAGSTIMYRAPLKTSTNFTG